MSKNFYCGVQAQNLAFDPTRVETGEHSGRLFTFGEADDTGHWPWRFLTPAEETEYATWQDRQRAADDGFGAAIGANVDVEADDLGTRWGESSAVPQSVTEAYEASQVTHGDIDFNGGEGKPALDQTGELMTIAQTLLDTAKSDPLNKRIAVILFHMEDVQEDTTGTISHIERASTVGDNEIIAVAEDMLRNRFMDRLKSLQTETAAKALEI